MSRTITAADRSALIRLASTMEPGSPERKAILAGLSKVASKLPPGFDDFDDFDDLGDEIEPTMEAKARDKFEYDVLGRAAPEASITEVLRRVPAGIIGFVHDPTASKPSRWYVWGDTDKSGAARLARALFKGRIPRTKRDPRSYEVYHSILYIGLNDGTLAKFVAPEGLLPRHMQSSERLASPMEKSASRMGVDIFRSFVDPKKFIATRRVLSMDKQSQDLLRQIQTELLDRLTPDDSTERALNRLSNLLSGSQDPANLRNQIFKVANELGIRLPSGMF
jgi:hypothetical protein